MTRAQVDPTVPEPPMGPHSAGPVTCTARAKATGQRCQRAPIRGGKVCYVHGGGAPAVKAAAARRLAVAEVEAEVENLIAFESFGGMGDPLQAMAELAERALATERALAARVNFLAQDDRLRFRDAQGRENLRSEVVLWERWHRQAAHLADRLAAHDWESRRVRLAEQQGALVGDVIRRVLNELRLTPDQEALIGEVVPRHLRALTAGEQR